MQEGDIMSIALLIVVVLLLILLVSNISKGRRQLEALIAHCDTANELVGWCMANPDLYIWDVPHAGEIVLRRIAAYRRFIETHPFIKDNGHLSFLESLLSQHEPPPPWGDYVPDPDPVLRSGA